MRSLLIILVVTLFFTGFDAARHVYGETLQDGPKTMAGMDCCPDDGTQGKSLNMKCHYCCAAVMGMQSMHTMRNVQIKIAVHVLMPPAPPAGPAYALFRPPRAI